MRHAATPDFGPENRQIDKRPKPPVKGIDLEQALNYVDLTYVNAKFVYNHYTSSELFYVEGSRPELETIVKRWTAGSGEPMTSVKNLVNFIVAKVPWAGFYEKDTGSKLPKDRGLSEEEIIDSGYGWCNEQARVLCCLTQIAGVPSRLVFAANKAKEYGHVVVETLVPAGWMLVDQSLGLCFEIDGRPVSAVDVYHDQVSRRYFEPIYRRLCKRLVENLGAERLIGDGDLLLADNPLDVFRDLGFHNHFVH